MNKRFFLILLLAAGLVSVYAVSFRLENKVCPDVGYMKVSGAKSLVFSVNDSVTAGIGFDGGGSVYLVGKLRLGNEVKGFSPYTAVPQHSIYGVGLGGSFVVGRFKCFIDGTYNVLRYDGSQTFYETGFGVTLEPSYCFMPDKDARGLYSIGVPVSFITTGNTMLISGGVCVTMEVLP